MKPAGLKDLFYTPVGVKFNIELNTLSLYVPVFITDPETVTRFIESIKYSYTSMFGSRTTDGGFVKTPLPYQLDIGS